MGISDIQYASHIKTTKGGRHNMNEKQSDSKALRDGLIDFAAYGGKAAVDYSSMKPIPKGLTKIGIDLGKEELKQLFDWLETQKKNASPVRRNSNDFQTIAKDCGLQQITHAWILFGDLPLPCYYMEGGDIAKFCKLVGISQFPETMSNKHTAKTIDTIKKYGVVIYRSEE